MTAAPPPFGRGLPGNRWDLLDGEWPASPPSVSVIVPYYRQQRELDRTLAALARQTHPADLLEVIVVDDGSPEPPTVPDGVVVLRQDDLGFRLAAARNTGVRAATGAVVCFLDADTAPEPEYVARLTRLVALAPETVTVGRRRHADFTGVPVDAPVEVAGPAAELDEPSWLRNAYARSGNLLEADDRSYRYLIGAVTACSRWFLDEVGGFDESFREYGGEDWEWAHRAWLGGAVFAHVPDAVAWHDGPEWAGRAEDDSARQRTKNTETLVLADAIPVRESRGLAVRSRSVDVLVRLLDAGSPARAYVCVDTVLSALPHATVVVPEEVAAVFAADQRVIGADAAPAGLPPRVVVHFDGPVRIDGDAGALADAVGAVGVEATGGGAVGAGAVGGGAVGAVGGGTVGAVGGGTTGVVQFEDRDGRLLARVESRRATLRHARWPDEELFTTRRQVVAWQPIDDEPGLAAYLGGWG